jgi:hypothetical protein
MAKCLIPSLNRVLVEKLVQPKKSPAGILLPETTKQVPPIDLAFFLLILFSGFVPSWSRYASGALEFGVVDRGRGVADSGCEWKEIDASLFLWGRNVVTLRWDALRLVQMRQ